MSPVLRAFLRAPSGVAAFVAVALLLALAVLAPSLFGEAATRGSIMRSGEPPGPDFLLGTDMLGRSILARVLVATRLSLMLALSATAIAAVLGVLAGVAVAVAPPRLRALGLRAIDVLLSFPGILLAIVVTAVVGIGIEGAVVAIGIAYAPDFARLASTLALSAAARDYVAAARVLGVGPGARLWRHILPNIGDAMLVSVFATAGAALIAVSSLSFLGLGVQPPQFDWGRMLVEGIESFYATPVAALAPAAMIAATGLALGFFGEALARAVNPLLWTAPEAARGAAPAGTAAGTEAGAGEVLEVAGLRVAYPGAGGVPVAVVDGVSVAIGRGEIVGVVGESGSGKSQTALAIARLLEPPAAVSCDRHRFLGHDLAGMAPAARRRLLGTRLAMVFQDPMASLNPTMTIGAQVAEPALVFGGQGRAAALALAARRLGEVGIPTPAARLGAYPHQFSGGMQQRAMIAMGLMAAPALLIADEPTTALDVTIQAQVLDLLRAVNREHGTAILLITHNIAVVAAVAHRVVVMYAGRVVEEGPADAVLQAPRHPYTRLLLAAMPRLEGEVEERLAAIEGQPPAPEARPTGCAFAPRCPQAAAACAEGVPALAPVAPGHRAACWREAA